MYIHVHVLSLFTPQSQRKPVYLTEPTKAGFLAAGKIVFCMIQFWHHLCHKSHGKIFHALPSLPPPAQIFSMGGSEVKKERGYSTHVTV